MKKRRITANLTARPLKRFVGRNPIQIEIPADKFSKIRVFIECITAIALLLSLAVSYTQMRSVQQKEADASEALELANTALQTSHEAQELVNLQQKSLKELKELEETTRQRARISYLTVKAENGDRGAFNELYELANNTRGSFFGPETSEYKNIQRILDVYRGDEIGDARVNMAAKIPPSVGEYGDYGGLLDSVNQESRAHGLSAVRYLRINKHIPKLIKMIKTEEDMHVLQLIGRVLTDLLQPVGYNKTVSIYDLAVTPESTVEELQEFWNCNSNALLSVKPRYWKKVENPPYAPKWVLTDPQTEKENSEQGSANEF